MAALHLLETAVYRDKYFQGVLYIYLLCLLLITMNKRCCLTILFIILFLPNVKPQTPSWDWARGSLGTPGGSNSGAKIKVGTTGNIFILGRFSDDSLKFGNTTLYQHKLFNGGANNFFLLKYDLTGNFLLAKNLCMGQFDGFGFDIDSNDNIYISGYFYKDSAIVGGTTLYNEYWNSDYQHNMFIAKFDSMGNAIWVKSNMNGGMYYAKSLHLDHFGNLYAFGSCRSADTISFDSTSVVVNDSASNLFIVKFTQSGRPLWIKTINDNNQGVSHAGWVDAADITTDLNGNIFITGSFSTPFLFFDSIQIFNYHTQGLQDDIFIAKYDSSGDIVWAKSQGGNSHSGDAGWSIRTDSSGNVYVAGYFTPNSTFDTVLLGGYGTFIAKYGLIGNLNWIRPVTGNVNSHISDFFIDVFGNSYLIGGFYGDSIVIDSIVLYNNPYPYATFSNCLFLTKLNNLGNVLWAEKGIGYANGASICADNLGNLYITGSFGRDSIIFGSNILVINNTYSTTFTAKLNLITGIFNNPVKDNSIIIFPNPSATFLNILAPNYNLESVNFTFYSAIGSKLFSKSVSNFNYGNSETIDISQLSPGIYFLEININEKRIVRKIIKE